MAHEYALAHSTLGLTEVEIGQTLYYAVEAAFTTAAVKERLKRKLGAVISDR